MLCSLTCRDDAAGQSSESALCREPLAIRHFPRSSHVSSTVLDWLFRSCRVGANSFDPFLLKLPDMSRLVRLRDRQISPSVLLVLSASGRMVWLKHALRRNDRALHDWS